MDETLNATIAMKKATLAAMTVEDGPLDAVKIILLKDINSDSENAVMADVVEADFTGYTAISAPVWSAPYVDGDFKVKVSAPSKTFALSGLTQTNTIKGWAIVNTDKSVLLSVVQFENNRALTVVGAGITIQPTYTYGS